MHDRKFARVPNLVLSFTLAMTTLAISWQFIILPFTGNDEPWHSTRAYAGAHLDTVLGVKEENRPLNFHGGAVVAPAWVFGRSITDPSFTDWRCFIHKPEIPANCAGYNWNDNAITNDPHPDSEYPPLGYFLIGLPTLLFDGQFAYYAMRITAMALTFGFVLIPLLTFFKKHVRRFPYLLMICFSPAVLMNVSTINIDGVTVGASIGTGLIVVSALTTPNFVYSKLWFGMLITYSSLLILFRQFGLAQLFSIVLFSWVMKVPHFWKWIRWILPPLLFELWRGFNYPTSFPSSTNQGLSPGANWAQSYFASFVSVIQNTILDFLQGDFQVSRIPIGLVLPFAIWVVVSLVRFFGPPNSRLFFAVLLYMTSFLLYSSIANNLKPDEWFLPWQGRYSYPSLLTLFALLWSQSLQTKLSLGSKVTALSVWFITMAFGYKVAIVRFYQGVAYPESLDWYTHLIGFVGNSPVAPHPRIALGLLLFVASAVFLARIMFYSELNDSPPKLTKLQKRH